MPELLTTEPHQPVEALSEKQERSIAHSTARINLWTGSIRSGKTIASLQRWVDYVRTAPRGGALVVTAKTFDTVSRNVFGPLMDPDIMGPVASQVKYTRGSGTATILGRQIEVITANDAKAEARLRGMTCSGAYGDEITLLPEGFFDQLLGRMSVRGAKLFGTSNPDNPTHWLRQRFILRQAELGGSHFRHWHFTLDDNPALDPEYVRSIKQEYTGLWYRRFILGEWVLAAGSVFDMFNAEQHVVDEVPLITRWISLGVDYGTVNPFHGVLLGLGVDGCLYLTREYRYDSRAARKQMTNPQYVKAVREWLADVPVPQTALRGVWPERIVIDPSATQLRLQFHGEGIASVLADNSVIPGLQTLASLFSIGALKVHRSCRYLIDEIGGYAWDDEAAAKGEDKPIKAADHGIDAMRYAIHSTRSIWRGLLRRNFDLAS